MWSNQTARQRVAFYTTAVTAEFQRQLYNFWQHHYLLATPCLLTCVSAHFVSTLLISDWSLSSAATQVRLGAAIYRHLFFSLKISNQSPVFTYYIFTSQDPLKILLRVRTLTTASYISKKLVGCQRKNFCVTFTSFICLFSGIVVLNHSGGASDNLIIFMGQFA